jgi:hypothetical protein
MRIPDPDPASAPANPYQPPAAQSATPKDRSRHSRIGIASIVFAIVAAVSTVVCMCAAMAGHPGNRTVADSLFQTAMIASALGVVTGIASLFVRSRPRTLGIVGLAIAGTIALGLVGFMIYIVLKMAD